MSKDAMFWKKKYDESQAELAQANTVIALLNPETGMINNLISNVVYDFASFLTCRNTVLTASASHDAAEMVKALDDFEQTKSIKLNSFKNDIVWTEFCK